MGVFSIKETCVICGGIANLTRTMNRLNLIKTASQKEQKKATQSQKA